MKSFHSLFATITAKVLIAANLIPLIGALFYGWDLRFILILYWVENLIIGFFNLTKMLMVVEKGLFLPERVAQCGFFIIHYGGFCAAHGLFLLGFLDVLPPANSGTIQGQSNNIFMQILSSIEPTFRHLHDVFGANFLLALTALFISHGFSLIENFFLRNERQKITFKKLFSAPYSRIVVLHITIIFGSLLVQKFGSPIVMLAALICLKIIIDLSLHKREHQSIQG